MQPISLATQVPTTPAQSPQADQYRVQRSDQQTTRRSPESDIAAVKTALAEHNIDLSFSTDPDTREVVVKLVDQQTGEAVRQIPSEVSLKLAAQFIKLNKVFVDKFE